MWVARQARWGTVVTAAKAVRGLPYVCLDCGRDVVLKRGEKISWHFAHKHVGSCRGETAQHQWGKWHWAQRALPLDVRLRVRCSGFEREGLGVMCGEETAYQLQWDADEVQEEYPVAGGVADVAFLRDGVVVGVVEVYVTSTMSQRRVEASNVPWVEVEGGTDGSWRTVRRASFEVRGCGHCEAAWKELYRAEEERRRRVAEREETDEWLRSNRQARRDARRARRDAVLAGASERNAEAWNPNWPDLSDAEEERLGPERVARFYVKEWRR